MPSLILNGEKMVVPSWTKSSLTTLKNLGTSVRCDRFFDHQFRWPCRRTYTKTHGYLVYPLCCLTKNLIILKSMYISCWGMQDWIFSCIVFMTSYFSASFVGGTIGWEANYNSIMKQNTFQTCFQAISYKMPFVKKLRKISKIRGLGILSPWRNGPFEFS